MITPPPSLPPSLSLSLPHTDPQTQVRHLIVPAVAALSALFDALQFVQPAAVTERFSRRLNEIESGDFSEWIHSFLGRTGHRPGTKCEYRVTFSQLFVRCSIFKKQSREVKLSPAAQL